MARRTNHGNDRKLRGERTVWESVPDGVRPVPDGAAAPVERRENGTVTPAGAAELARMRHEAAKMPDFGDRTYPWMPPLAELKPYHDARCDLQDERRKEIHEQTGGVDSGVGARIRAYSFIHAAGEYWAAKFFATGDPEAFQRMVTAFKAASSEDDKLRDAAVWAAKTRRKGRSLADVIDAEADELGDEHGR